MTKAKQPGKRAWYRWWGGYRIMGRWHLAGDVPGYTDNADGISGKQPTPPTRKQIAGCLREARKSGWKVLVAQPGTAWIYVSGPGRFHDVGALMLRTSGDEL